MDVSGLLVMVFVIVIVDVGVIVIFSEYINVGWLDYINYVNCYFEYSDSVFKLNEFLVSGQLCQWQDDDVFCVGLQQVCSVGGDNGLGGDGGFGGDGGDSGSGNICVEYMIVNYYYKVGGWVYSIGNYWVLDYFVQGINVLMSGFIWGSNMLYFSDGSNWLLGSCL